MNETLASVKKKARLMQLEALKKGIKPKLADIHTFLSKQAGWRNWNTYRAMLVKADNSR